MKVRTIFVPAFQAIYPLLLLNNHMDALFKRNMSFASRLDAVIVSLAGISFCSDQVDLLFKRINGLPPYDYPGSSFYLFSDNMYFAGELASDYGGFKAGQRVFLSIDGAKWETSISTEQCWKVLEYRLLQMGLTPTDPDPNVRNLFRYVYTSSAYAVSGSHAMFEDVPLEINFNQSGSPNTFLNNNIKSWAVVISYYATHGDGPINVQDILDCAAALGGVVTVENVAPLPPLGTPHDEWASMWDSKFLKVDLLGYDLTVNPLHANGLPATLMPCLEYKRGVGAITWKLYPPREPMTNEIIDCQTLMSLCYAGMVVYPEFLVSCSSFLDLS